MSNRVRISELSKKDFIDHRVKKLEIGQREYGDSDLQRYNLLDVLEEQADSLNILDRFENRLEHEDDLTEYEQSILDGDCTEYKKLREAIEFVYRKLFLLDAQLSDTICSDENGGNRVHFGDINNFKGEDTNE